MSLVERPELDQDWGSPTELSGDFDAEIEGQYTVDSEPFIATDGTLLFTSRRTSRFRIYVAKPQS